MGCEAVMASEHSLDITSGPLASAVWRCIPDVASGDPWIEVLRVCYEHAGRTGNLEHLNATEGHTITLLAQFLGTCDNGLKRFRAFPYKY